MKEYEDYQVNNIDDVFFDSKGDISVNYFQVNEEIRNQQLVKDIYHLIKVNQIKLLSYKSNPEKITFIKSLFYNDTRILSFDVTIEKENIYIENLELR